MLKRELAVAVLIKTYFYLTLYTFYYFSIENGFRINSSIIDVVNGDVELVDNNDNSKSSVSKQVIKNTLTFEFISLAFLTNSKPFIFGICKSEIIRL
jgi:hypothetical protein